MKKILVYFLLLSFATSVAATSCVRAKPGCKKSSKKVKKMRSSGQIKM